ncbi:MAG: CD225/dispanin family protein [Prevotella sp.]|nr:CD225/dispanin family protein [Prevotella sp.]
MRSYYYVNALGQLAGPVTTDSFKNNGITKDTNVWCCGMSGWTRAGDVPELKHLFNDTNVPPIPPVNPTPPPMPGGGQCPNNYLVFAILSTILCCLPTGIAAIIFSTKVDKQWAQGDKIGAQKSSEQAKLWCLISLGCGIVSGIIGFFLGILGSL